MSNRNSATYPDNKAISDPFNEDENYRGVRKIRGAGHSICNLRHKTPKQILRFFIMVLIMPTTS